MRVHAWGRAAIPITIVILSLAVGGLNPTPAVAGSGASLDMGGGVLAGGYFGELKHDWNVGLGGSLFIQMPFCCDFEGRLRGSMLWNDGSLDVRVPDNEDADLGAKPWEAPRSFRRTSFELSLLYRVERFGLGEVGVPYLGMGISTYERKVEYQDTRVYHDLTEPADPTVRNVDARDWGFHAIGGLRLYRTSGLFLALEGTFHGIDTPNEWTGAYDASLLLGVQIDR